jgi:hypothetical protein
MENIIRVFAQGLRDRSVVGQLRDMLPAIVVVCNALVEAQVLESTVSRFSMTMYLFNHLSGHNIFGVHHVVLHVVGSIEKARESS